MIPTPLTQGCGRLANNGRDLKTARDLLIQFETMLPHHIADRDRIELAAFG
jgi:hypothetical protein